MCTKNENNITVINHLSQIKVIDSLSPLFFQFDYHSHNFKTIVIAEGELTAVNSLLGGVLQSLPIPEISKSEHHFV
jgi:hypothetical protein